MPDDAVALPLKTGAKASEPNSHDSKSTEKAVDTRKGLAVSSALQGHVDYVDLTERVALGVTVKMPDAAVKATPGTQLLFATPAETSAEAPPASPTDTTADDDKT